MKKLTLAAAKLVAEHTKRVLPIVRLREGEKINLAMSGVAIAEHAKEEDKELAKNELLTWKTLLDEQIAEQPKRAADAVQQLKKLTHPTDKNAMPIRLPPRRLRREAERLLAKTAHAPH